MNRCAIASLLVMAALCLPSLLSATDSEPGSLTVQTLTGLPLAFTQNNGQWDDRVLFCADGGTATVWITGEEVYPGGSSRLFRPHAWADWPFALDQHPDNHKVVILTEIQRGVLHA